MIKEKQSVYITQLKDRRLAYANVFGKKDDIATDIVIKDLAKFCRAHESTFHKDPRMHAVLEGRREVWLRIQEYLQLTIEQIYQTHKIAELKEKDDDNARTT